MSSEDTTIPTSADPLKERRRVQWSDSTQAHQQALDEQGLNPDPFDTLTGALERHQSTREPPQALREPRVHYFPPRRQQPPTLDTNNPFINVTGDTPSTARTSPLSAINPLPEEQHLVPGQYIDENEHDGVPLANTDGDVSAQNQAVDIVRAHTKRSKGTGGTRRWFSNRRTRAQESTNDSRVKRKDYGSNADIEREAESSATLPDDSMPMPGGLLSALLTLYGEGQNLPASGTITPDTASGRSSFDGPPDRPWVEKTPPAVHRLNPLETSAPFDEKTGEFISPQNPSPVATTFPTRPGHKTKTSNPFQGMFGARPQNERNGAGTLASLIASTGNITGVAAPKQSQIQPNLKRPGYALTRYSMDDKIPTLKSTSKHHSSKSVGGETKIDSTSTVDLAQNLRPLDTPSPGKSNASTPPLLTPGYKSKFTGKLNLKDLAGRKSGPSTPGSEWSEWIWDNGKKAISAEEKKRRGEKERKKKRKKAEIFITKHVAEIIQRQQFICKMARAMMMFGGPSHRLQPQVQATARVLEISLACMYLPDVMLISFDDAATGTSQIKFIRQPSSLDLQKLTEAYVVYWKVIHDDLSVAEASTELDNLMKAPPCYRAWQLCIIGGMASSAICTLSFSGSFVDALTVFPMGALLVGVQLLSVRNELYSNVFEITMAILFSFLSAALASTHKLCYSAMASSAVVLILPGFIVLGGALEIMSRNIVSGAVRMMYAVIYCLFLGFGLAMGGQAWATMSGEPIYGTTDYICQYSHDQDIWYRATPSTWWAFLTVPLFAASMSLRNMCSWKQNEFPVLIGIACVGWVTNHFTSTKFVNQSDFCAAVGAFAVGIVANVWARIGFFTGNNAFVIMITGILLQLPSGLGAGGLLGWVNAQTSDNSSSYLSGFQTALQLVSVAIGLTVGLGISLVIVNPIQSRKRQGAVFSL